MTLPRRVHRIADLIGSDRQHVHAKVREGAGIEAYAWVRPVPYPKEGSRIRAAWWVLTGRAEAVIWPRPQEVERAWDA